MCGIHWQNNTPAVKCKLIFSNTFSFSFPSFFFFIFLRIAPDCPSWLPLSAVVHGFWPCAEDIGRWHPEWSSQIVSFYLPLSLYELLWPVAAPLGRCIPVRQQQVSEQSPQLLLSDAPVCWLVFSILEGFWKGGFLGFASFSVWFLFNLKSRYYPKARQCIKYRPHLPSLNFTV